MSDYKQKCEGTPIYSGARVIGHIEGDIFKKSLIYSRHSLRTPRAWAVSVDSLVQAERAGAAWVEIYARDTKTIYRASIEQIRRVGIPIERGGFEKQLALVMDGWIIRRKGGEHAEQIDLFAGGG